MIHLYAEHLLNIHTLSIQATLSTRSNQDTTAKLSPDGQLFTITHDGETASITLPTDRSPVKHDSSGLIIPAVPARDLTFRIRLNRETATIAESAHFADTNIVPWTADTLTRETEVCCRTCNSILVDRGTIQHWKDLPSDGWAEMMDFWHCHKPDEPHSHNHTPNKGYAAGSQLALQSGLGMVAVMSFLFAAEDCKNIEISPSSEPRSTIKCGQCQARVGQTEVSGAGYELSKAQLAVSPSSNTASTSYSSEKWFAGLLLNAMENQGVRKFVVQEDTPSSSDALRVWIFTPDLSVSICSRPHRGYMRVSKVLWQECSASLNGAETLTGSALSEGELKVPDGDLQQLKSILLESYSALPEPAREFQQWHVGLLERFPSIL